MIIDEFIALLKKWMPQTYWGNLEGKSGWEIFQAIASIGARLSRAVQVMQNNLFPSTAQGGVDGGYKITVTPSNAPAVLKIGSLLMRDDGALYRVEYAYGGGDLVWTADTDPIVASIVPVVQFEQSRAPDAGKPQFSLFLRAEGTSDGTVSFSFSNFQNISDEYNGRSPALDLLAWQRGLLRMRHETDDALRQRIRSSVDMLNTKPAIEACITKVGLTGNVIEGFEETPPRANYFRIKLSDYVTSQMCFVDYAYSEQAYCEGWQEPGIESQYSALRYCVNTHKSAGVYWEMEDSTGIHE